MRVIIFRADVMDQNLREGQLSWALILDISFFKDISFIYSFIHKFLVLVKTSFSDSGFRFQILDYGFLYSTANDPQPQMIPRPQMIPKMDRK